MPVEGHLLAKWYRLSVIVVCDGSSFPIRPWFSGSQASSLAFSHCLPQAATCHIFDRSAIKCRPCRRILQLSLVFIRSLAAAATLVLLLLNHIERELLDFSFLFSLPSTDCYTKQS